MEIEASLTQPIERAELWRAEQVQDAEAGLADQAGISLYQLMERAGNAVFQAMRERWPEAKRIGILCGVGNNGGDGYIVARLALRQGLDVRLYQVGDLTRQAEQASQARERLLSSFPDVNVSAGPIDQDLDLVVDALLGVGIRGEVRPEYTAVIDQVNALDVPCIAIDLPSGLNANTGEVSGAAIKADMTISMIALKQGLFTGQAADHVGELLIAELGVADMFVEQASSKVKQIYYEQFKHLLKPRHRTCHKSECGRVCLIGGNLGMPGAIRMAGEASMRTGAGLVSVFTHPNNAGTVMAGRPELMVAGIADPNDLMDEHLERMDVINIGPGLGRSEWARSLFERTLAATQPLVLDADALNLLVDSPQWRQNWILTPHPGEAARLLGVTIEKVEKDRFAAARNIQSAFGGVCILKGAGTLIATDEGVMVARVGNPGMATGGMGDVLSGIIAGLLAQGLSLSDAAALGVCIHGEAADLAVAEGGERGLLASDLYPHVRRLVNPA